MEGAGCRCLAPGRLAKGGKRDPLRLGVLAPWRFAGRGGGVKDPSHGVVHPPANDLPQRRKDAKAQSGAIGRDLGGAAWVHSRRSRSPTPARFSSPPPPRFVPMAGPLYKTSSHRDLDAAGDAGGCGTESVGRCRFSRPKAGSIPDGGGCAAHHRASAPKNGACSTPRAASSPRSAAAAIGPRPNGSPALHRPAAPVVGRRPSRLEPPAAGTPARPRRS